MNKFIFKSTALLILLFLTSCGNSGKRNNQAEEPHLPPLSDTIKPIVNVYIDNTISMNGYVKGVTEFEQIIFSFLTDIKISGITDSMTLNYINSKIIPYRAGLSDFIERLEPETFVAMGGDIGVTEISNIINSVLLNTGENDISILVTDGIFSPGTGFNAQDYLKNQQIRIRGFMANHLARLPETAVIIYKLGIVN